MARKKDSSLVDSAVWNNNYWIRTPYKQDKVFIHIMCAVRWTGDQCGRFFKSAGVSSNYGIGYKGDICQYVEEKYGAWAQGSKIWNQKGISIELANSSGKPDWKISPETLQACIELVADIYKRNGFGLVRYTGDTSGNLCMHRWVASTSCPGPYVAGQFEYIADEANKLLKGKVRLPERGYYILGDKGMGVKNLQIFLKKQKFYTGKTGGNYKTLTYKAVKKFQKAYGLKVDGEWGRECQKKYEELTR